MAVGPVAVDPGPVLGDDRTERDSDGYGRLGGKPTGRPAGCRDIQSTGAKRMTG